MHVEQSGSDRRLGGSQPRGWIDNGNKVVDCDLLNPAQNTAGGDTCASVSGNNVNFGKPGTATIVNPAVMTGWGTP